MTKVALRGLAGRKLRALLTGIGFFAYGRYVRPETLFVAALAGGFALCLIGIRDARRPLCAAGLTLSPSGPEVLRVADRPLARRRRVGWTTCA